MLKDDLLTEREVFFQENEFACEVILPDNSKIVGIFDDEYRGINIQDGEVATTHPQVICISEQVEGLSVGAIIKIQGKEYKIIEKQPDGTGITTLILSKD